MHSPSTRLHLHKKTTIEALCCSAARIRVPQLFLIFARFFGILVPSKIKKLPGPWVDGWRTTVERQVCFFPGKSHVKEMAAVRNQLNKLQVGEWLTGHMESDGKTRCCYIADGAESQQIDYLGRLLSRRVNGKLDITALSLDNLCGKSTDDQVAAFRHPLEEVSELML